MNPGEKGWLKAYLNFRKRRWRSEPSVIERALDEAPDVERYLYRLVQPTGLMYGYAICFIEAAPPAAADWTERERLKVLLAECYLALGFYFRDPRSGDRNRSIQQALADIRDFYVVNSALFRSRPEQIFGRRSQPLEQIEYVLDRRIVIQYDWSNFWSSFLQNSFLLFDLIQFADWMQNPPASRPENPHPREALMIEILRVIAAAAHADGKVTKEEKELFNYFLQSANLPPGQKRQAAAFLSKGVRPETLRPEAASSWILKKYFLELAILTTGAKRAITEEEREFLQSFAAHLGLPQEELLASMDAVLDFVQQYWQKVHYLQEKQNYLVVSERLIRRLRILVRKNQRMIAQEIEESKELVFLLRKSAAQELTPVEKEKVREQLLDILRSIPAITVFMLPFGSITLPILLRIIPKYILYPSSFRQRDDDDEDPDGPDSPTPTPAS
jgi:hypothetical protein